MKATIFGFRNLNQNQNASLEPLIKEHLGSLQEDALSCPIKI